MSNPKQRYVFIDFDDLKKVKFSKLEKVCEKLFIIINENEKNIPFNLVQQVQKLGSKVKWISAAPDNQHNFDLQISFLLGRMHQKAHRDIEFAVLTNNTSFDTLVEFINDSGRECLRVKRKKTKKEKTVLQNKQDVAASEDAPVLKLHPIPQPIIHSDELITHAASETIERLIQSGNRPAKVEVLKHYILMHHKQKEVTENLDAVLKKITDSNEIKIEENEVLYNF